MADFKAKGAVGVSGGGSSIPPSDREMWTEVLKSLRKKNTPPIHILRQLREALYDKSRDNKRSLPIALRLAEIKDARGNIVAHGEEAWRLLQKWMAELSLDENEIAQRAGQKNQSLPEDGVSPAEAVPEYISSDAVPMFISRDAGQPARANLKDGAKSYPQGGSSDTSVDSLTGIVIPVIRLGIGGKKGGGSAPASPAGGGPAPTSPPSGSKTSALEDLESVASFFRGVVSFITGYRFSSTTVDKAISGFIDSSETYSASAPQIAGLVDDSTYNQGAMLMYETSSAHGYGAYNPAIQVCNGIMLYMNPAYTMTPMPMMGR